MNARLFPVLFVCALSLMNCSSPSSQVHHNQLTSEEQSAGWRLLFDGKTFAGWEGPAAKSPAGDAWVVEGGCIKAVEKPRIREDLFTIDQFGDFELAFDWKISSGGNSGVKYRIQDRVSLIKGKLNPDAKRFEDTVDYELRHRASSRSGIPPGAEYEEYVIAYEYQLIDNDKHPDAGRNADRSAGSIYSLVAPVKPVVRPAGEFNESRIILWGNHVQHWLNGAKIVDTSLDSPEIAKQLAERWTTRSPVYELLTKQPKKQTSIALQHHVDEVWFRNIKIRPL